MSYFDLEASEKELAGADYVARVQRALIKAYLHKAKSEKLTKAQLARTLGVEKSTISRMLSGKANLTSKSIGELCWALDVNPKFVAEDFPSRPANSVSGSFSGRVAAFAPKAQTFERPAELVVSGR